MYDDRVKSMIGKVVKHFKGKDYLVINLAEHTETGELMVIYKALYGDYKVYVRTIEMFTNELDKVKYPNCNQKYRFELK